MNVDYRTPQTLIEEHQGLVLSICKKIHRRLPPYIRFDDVLSYGQLGLLQAARSYNDGMGSTFATFAYYRIRGAVYDGLTKMAWSSRAEYRRAKASQVAQDVLETAGEPTSATNAADDDYRWLIETSDRLTVVYLNSHAGSDDQAALDVEDSRTVRPDEELGNRETMDAVRGLIAKLPEAERSLIELTYFQDHSLAEASAKLGKSRSWGCRIHAKVLEYLGRSLQALGLDPA